MYLFLNICIYLFISVMFPFTFYKKSLVTIHAGIINLYWYVFVWIPLFIYFPILFSNVFIEVLILLIL